MKVLLAHNFYRSSAPSGEDAVYRNERSLLEAGGIEVVPFERFNDEIDDSTLARQVSLALRGAWSRRTHAELSAFLRRTRPDVAHFHNTFPLISPSAYAACRDRGVPVVQTLHNFRFICPGALLLRDGRPCEACVGTSLFPALRHRCYRGSLTATGAQVWTLVRNRFRGTYRNLVHRYIALSGFAAVRLAEGGLPADRIEVKPNFLPVSPPVGKGDGGFAVYVGRLQEEKGVRTLLAAWRELPGFSLKVIGDGTLRAEMERQARREGLPVEFCGYRTKEEVLGMVGRSEMLIVPSVCYEGFPMALLEAYACGTPVVASRIGSLDELVVEDATGVKFEPGNSRDLAAKAGSLRKDRARLAALRRGARWMFEMKYTAENNFPALLGIYERAMDDSAGNGCACKAVVNE
jgi:glycosyltransferase involved in cell wall biosynthesis